MNINGKLLPLLLLLLPGLVSAHGPSRQRVIKEISIDAAPDKVWGLIRDFCSISTWNPAISDCTADSTDQLG
ncbi:MAG: SRPBCC family protein, partial [Gammaproteobacteria bacterium]